MAVYTTKASNRYPQKSVLVMVMFGLLLIFSVNALGAECLGERTQIYGGRLVYDDLSSTPIELCVDNVVMTAVEYAVLNEKAEQMDDIDPIDAASIAVSFTWGFGTYMGFWFMGYTIKTARGVIRKV